MERKWVSGFKELLFSVITLVPIKPSQILDPSRRLATIPIRYRHTRTRTHDLQNKPKRCHGQAKYPLGT